MSDERHIEYGCMHLILHRTIVAVARYWLFSIHQLYKDVVILLRGLGSWAEVIIDVFAKEGIPVNVESRTGYFSAIEIYSEALSNLVY